MKKLLFIIPLFSLLFYSSCHLLDDPEEVIDPPLGLLPPPAEEYIEENYPDFTIEEVEEDEICGGNEVYEVELEDGPGPDIELYFDLDGEFLFAASEMEVAGLPASVLGTIETEYPEAEIEEAELYEFPDGSVQYYLELEGDMQEVELVLNEDGSIACSEEEEDDDDEDDDDEEEVDLPMDVLDFINSNYDGYEVEEAEEEELCNGTEVYEVELEDGPGPDLELYFDLDWEFLFAASEMEVADLPASVISTLETAYPDADIEEAELYEFPDGSVQYYVELEGDMQEVELLLNEDGSIACSEDEDDDDEDDDDGISPPGNIIGFINSNYGGQGYVEAELDDLCGDVEVYLVKLDEGPGQNTGNLEVYFDLDWEFLFDAMEVLPSALPTEVEGTLEAAYPGYTLEEDDVEQYNMADGSLQYKVELETSSGEGIEATIDTDGNILCER